MYRACDFAIDKALNRFNTVTFVYLSRAMIWTSNFTCRVRVGVLMILVELLTSHHCLNFLFISVAEI